MKIKKPERWHIDLRLARNDICNYSNKEIDITNGKKIMRKEFSSLDLNKKYWEKIYSWIEEYVMEEN